MIFVRKRPSFLRDEELYFFSEKLFRLAVDA